MLNDSLKKDNDRILSSQTASIYNLAIQLVSIYPDKSYLTEPQFPHGYNSLLGGLNLLLDINVLIYDFLLVSICTA